MASAVEAQEAEIVDVNSAINDMDQIVRNNATLAAQSTAASQTLSQQTEELAGLIALFKIGGGDAPRAEIPHTTEVPAGVIGHPR